MVEACPVCDTLWRLYTKAIENLQELVGKCSEARGKGDQTTAEILSHEITIAESALRTVRRELKRHETGRHENRQNDQRSQQKEQGHAQKH